MRSASASLVAPSGPQLSLSQSQLRGTDRNAKGLAMAHLASGILFTVLGVLLALAHLAAVSFPSLRWRAGALISGHSLVMVYLCFLPGLSMSLGPYLNAPLLSALRPRLQWLGLLFLWSGAGCLGASTMTGSSVGFRYFLAYEARPTTSIILASFGVLLVASALALNGALWFLAERRAVARGESNAFLGALAVAGTVHVVALPLATLLPMALVLERMNRWAPFNPARGGELTLIGNAFWLYVQPATVAALLPVFGLMHAAIGQSSQRFSFCRHSMMKVLAPIAVLAFLSWGFRVGPTLNPTVWQFFAVTGLLLVFSLGYLVFDLSADLALASERIAALAQLRLALFMFGLGVLGCLVLVLPDMALRFSGTAFEVAQWHWLAAGATLVPMLMGLGWVNALQQVESAPSQLERLALGALSLGLLLLFALETLQGFSVIRQRLWLGGTVAILVVLGLAVIATGLLARLGPQRTLSLHDFSPSYPEPVGTSDLREAADSDGLDEEDERVDAAWSA